MAIESTAELLFNITANSDDAAANMEQFRDLMAGDLADVRENFEQFTVAAVAQQMNLAAALDKATASEAAQTVATEALAEAHGHAVSQIQATSGAIRLLEGSGGIRAMERFTVTTLGLGPAMQAIFPVVGALAFAEIIVRMGEKVYGMVEQWNPVVQAEQRAADTAKAVQSVIQQTGEEIKKLNLEALTKSLGVPTAKIVEADQILRTNIAADKLMISNLTASIEAAERTVAAAKTATDETDLQQVMAAAKEAQADLKNYRMQLSAYQMDLEKQELIVSKTLAEGAEAQLQQNEKAGSSAREATQEFFGLATIVESMRSKIASEGTGWDKLREEAEHYRVEIEKATAQLEKMHKAGTVTAQSYQAEKAALLQIPELLARVVNATTAKLSAADTQAWGDAISKSLDAEDKLAEEQEKAGERRVEVSREINDRLAEDDEQSYALQRSRLIQQMNAWAAELAKKTALTAADWDAVDKITSEGLAKIDRTEATAFQLELVKLREHLDATVAANATAQDKLFLDEQKELEKYSAIEEQKTLLTAKSNQQRAQIEQMYAQIRAQILQKYQNDLQTLMNSQGFQGIFGNYFGSMIKQNQALFQQWSQSANQSIMLVKVSLEGLQEMASKAFQTMIQGLGQTIVQAFVAGKSVTQAMEQMLKSTLESFAGQALTAAIMATGWGFYWMALQDYSAAGSAFTSAAIFGTIAAATAIGAKYMPGGNAAGGGSGSGAGAGARSGGGAGYASGGGGGQGNQVSNVYVNVDGHVIGPSGVSQLIDMINQGVYGNSMTLYASHNPNGIPL